MGLEPYATTAEYLRGSFDASSRTYTLTAPSNIANLDVKFINGDGAEDIRFLKIDGFGEALEGAKFKLYTDPLCTQLYTNETLNDFAVSSNTGLVSFKAAPGVYYMKETEVPDSSKYQDNGNVYRIVVGSKGATEAGITLNANEEFRIEVVTVVNATTVTPKDVPDISAYGILNISKDTRKVILKKISTTYDPLKGAKFEILRVDRTGISGYDVKGDLVSAFISSDDHGTVYVGEFEYGTYYLKEKPLSGYTQITTDDPDGYNWFVLTVNEHGVGYASVSAADAADLTRLLKGETNVPTPKVTVAAP